MNYVSESALSDSYIYSMFNTNKSVTLRISEAYKTGKRLDSSYIEEQILQIKRTRFSPLVEKVLLAFEHGDIILLYSDTVIVSQAIPFVVIKTGSNNKALIFVNKFGTVSDNGEAYGGKILNIPMKDLYVLMEGAYLALKYYENGTTINRSTGLMRLTSNIYTSMMLRILNKEFALSMDQELYNSVSFIISRFYLEKVWECANKDLIFNYACQNIISPNKMNLRLVDDQYTSAGIDDISELITFISKFSPRMAKLTTRYFVECYINNFKIPATLSMDTFPYFLFVLICAYNGSFLVNQPIINDIIKNISSSNIFYNELSKIV